MAPPVYLYLAVKNTLVHIVLFTLNKWYHYNIRKPQNVWVIDDSAIFKDTLTTRFIVAGNITVNSVHSKHLFWLKRLH
jgi:hypothetical protein